MKFDEIFTIDYFALAIILTFGFLWFFFKPKKQQSPSLNFSTLNPFQREFPSWRVRYANLPNQLAFAALAFFALAFIDPHTLSYTTPTSQTKTLGDQVPTEGIAIYLLLDRSSSMKEKTDLGPDQPATSKIDLLKSITEDFVSGNLNKQLRGHYEDLIGLVGFARVPNVLSPLTLDHENILNNIKTLNTAETTDEDGTAIGYAIFKTVNLIEATKHFSETLVKEGKPSYNIKNSIMIVITDGFQFPNPLDKGKRLRNIDLVEAAEYAKTKNIKLYLINIDPAIKNKDYEPHRNQMKRITELTGGKFYILKDSKGLNEIYADIDEIEKGPLPSSSIIKKEPKHYQKRTSYNTFLIGCGLLLLVGAFLLETTLFRRIP